MKKELLNELTNPNSEKNIRLAKDKKHYKLTLIGAIDSFPKSFKLAENQEIKEFSINASNRVTDILNQLLTELENL